MTYVGGTSTAESTGTVSVKEFVKFSASFSTEMVKSNPAEASLKILNEGNGHEAFKIELEDANKIKEKGINIEMSKTQTEEIAPLGYDNITVKVSYDGSKVSGDVVHATFRVTSLSDENVSKGVLLTIELKKEGLGAVSDAVKDVWDTYGIGLVVLIVVLVIVGLVMKRRSKKRAMKGDEEEIEEEEEESQKGPPES
jgi:hypothetical protein